MMPENTLSTPPKKAPFVGARVLPISKIVDYEDGGIAIQDPSSGLLYQRWRARLFYPGEIDSYVVLDAREVSEFIWITVPYMTEISFTFDANMQPVVAYVVNGLSFLNWFDSVTGQYVTTTLGADIITPRVTLDDKRLVGSNGYQQSDVILGYIRAGDLYYRQQRDRFNVERLLKTNVKPLIKIGFTRGLRLQFMSEV